MKKINFKSVNLQLLVVIFLFIALNVAIYLSGKNADNRNRAAGGSVCAYDNAVGKVVCIYPTNTPVPLPTANPSGMQCTLGNTGSMCINEFTNEYCQRVRFEDCTTACSGNCGLFGKVTPGAPACAVGMSSDAICRCSNGGKGHIYQDKYCNSECVCDGVAVPTQYLPPSTSGSPGASNLNCPSGITKVSNSLCFSSSNGEFTANLYTCPPGSDISAGCQKNPKQVTGSTICMNNTVCGVQQLDVVGAVAGSCFMTSNSNNSSSCNPPSSSGVSQSVPTAAPQPTVLPTTVPTNTPTITPTSTPKVCVVPTPPVCSNGILLQKKTPDGCPEYVCVVSEPSPTRVPTATSTPKVTSVCKVSFDLPDQAVCWKDQKKGVPITFKVHSLPSTGGPYYVQTDWFIVLPNEGPHHYEWSQLAVAGKTYTIYADWPGIPDGYKGTVENHAGINIVDKYGTPVTPQCSGGIDYFWTPYVNCPELTPTKTVACTVPTPKDPPTMSCDSGNGGGVTWKWANVAGATQYEVDIYKTDGTKVIDNGWVAGSSYSCSTGTCSYKTTLPAGGYYSMIRATGSGACGPSAWARSTDMLVDICPPTTCNKNLDIAIVIDRSGSMARYKEPNGLTKLQMAKKAAQKVVDAIKSTGSTKVKFSVVSYGAQGNDGKGTLASSYNSTLNSALTNNYSSVLTAINNVNFSQDLTCIQCGIRIANKQLTNVANRRVEILLSDGIANRSWNGVGNNSSYPAAITDAINEAISGRNAGIEYRVLGYGDRMLGMTVDGGINEKSLTSIAGSTTNYSYSPDATVWSNSFMQVVKDLCK